MTELEAMREYDRAGEAAARGGPFAAVRWPDVALDRANLERLAEGVLGARLDLAGEAFGPDFDSAACGDRLEEAWRTDALQVRFAPEGVSIRAAFSVRVTLADAEDDAAVAAGETLELGAEICLSFVERHHTRPFVDFMGGEVRRASDGATRKIDPFAFAVEPAAAVAWGLNGCGG